MGERRASQIITACIDMRRLAGVALVAEVLSDHGVSGIDVLLERDVSRDVERAVKALHGLHHGHRNERIQPPGKQEHSIASQPGEIVDAAGRGGAASGRDTPLRFGRTPERAWTEMRADADRPEHVAREVVACTEIRAAGKDRRAHDSRGMRDMELVREEGA